MKKNKNKGSRKIERARTNYRKTKKKITKEQQHRKKIGKNRAKSSVFLKTLLTLLPGLLAQAIDNLRLIFTTATLVNFVSLLIGTVVCMGKRTISRIIVCAGIVGKLKHFTVFYKFFSRAEWSVEELSEVLCRLVLRLLPRNSDVFAIIDDTLFERKGRQIWGVSKHFDPIRSEKKKNKLFTFGHNWVILSIWVPLPWGLGAGIALPVLFRLYRNKKTCPPNEYKKRTYIAAEMIQKLRELVPLERKVWIIGDNEFVCQTIIDRLPRNCDLIGPIRINSVFHEEPLPHKGRGRRAKKGKRLPTIKEILSIPKYQWEKRRIPFYGEWKTIQYKSFVAISSHMASGRKVRVVITSERQGDSNTEDPNAFLCTDISLAPCKVLSYYCRRWPEEITHREAKQMGVGDAQNGFWRRGGKRGDDISNHSREERGRKAVLRTVPFYFAVYTLVAVCFLRKRNYKRAFSRVKRLQYWYNTKKVPSFSTMLFDLRIEILKRAISQKAVSHPQIKYVLSYLEYVLASA